MKKRAAGFLLVLLLSGCSFPPIEALLPTPTCQPGLCETATLEPTTLVMTPTDPVTPSPGTVEPASTDTLFPTDTPEVATSTPEPVETETPFLPTGIAELTSTATVTSSPGPTSTRTPIVSDKYYILQDGTPRLIQNFVRASLGCKWMGAAGQVFGAGGVPMKNMVVVVTGELDGKLIDGVGLTGLDSAYGSGGYEIQITDKPVDSTGELFVQLFDLNGMELSVPYPFDTSSKCEENLVIINFIPNS